MPTSTQSQGSSASPQSPLGRGAAAGWPVAKVRRTFIEFFENKPAAAPNGHRFVASSPVVPHDDPTLLFTNAGMIQFKPLFLNQTQAGSALHGLKRAVNSQKCNVSGGSANPYCAVRLTQSALQ